MDFVNLFDSDEEVKEIEELKEKIYSTKIQIPQYTPSEVCPSLSDCHKLNKYYDLLREIESSNVTDVEKQFLKIAATRHIQFNYSKIADYYAHASKEMQELMEHNALVILDIKDAIAQGYVQLSKRMDSIIGDSLDD